LIYAGAGSDTLTGGGGADIFQFRDILDSTVSAPDRVIDFAADLDKIDLSFIDANSGLDGNQAFTSIGNAAFSKAAGELRYAFDAASNLWKVEGDINGDGLADFLINLTVNGQNPITDGSFIF
nr:M10 family metallopeptidase C-terminal domain-containing protein [Pseudomonadota bacterium]